MEWWWLINNYASRSRVMTGDKVKVIIGGEVVIEKWLVIVAKAKLVALKTI